SGPALTVAAQRVALDLNGHTVSVASTSDPNDVVIRLATGADDVWISNGRLVGGDNAIATMSNSPMSLRIEGLTLTDQGDNGINLSADTVIRNLDMTDNEILGDIWTAVVVLANMTGRVERNRLTGWSYGFDLRAGVGLHVRDNVVSPVQSNAYTLQ